MDLAELFHVSVDALIGFTMRGNDADAEADRIEALSGAASAGETKEMPSILEIAGEYENALRKFPNHFRIVYGAALTFQQIGTLYRKDAELRRALELFRHAIDLLSQNRDPEINEVRLRNEIAACYSSLKEYGKAIEEFKKNNITGSNDARIGLMYTQFVKKPEEGIVFTEKAFISHLGDMITTMAGYLSYDISTARYDQGIRAAEWTIRFLESLKDNPDRPAFADKIVSLFYLDLAILQDCKGLTEASEKSLRTAVRMAAAFDREPVFTLANMNFLSNADQTGVYDDTGPTALDGLKSSMKELCPCISDAFRQKFDREIRENRGTR